MGPEEETKRMPPSPADVAQRALILSAVMCRGHIENAPADAASLELYPRILQWLNTCHLMEALEPEEHAIIHTPLGSLGERQRLEAMRKIEGTAILAWAIGKYPLPPHEARVDPFKVADALGFLWDGAEALIRFPRLRSAKELHAYLELGRAIYHRLCEAVERPQRTDFDRCIEPAWLRALGLTRASPVAGGDLVVDGQPLHQIEPGHLCSLRETIAERHRAATWLVGEMNRYWQFSPAP